MSSSLATAIRGYVTVRPFGSMVIPVPVQNLVLRNFAAQQNALARKTDDCKKGIDGFLKKEKIEW